MYRTIYTKVDVDKQARICREHAGNTIQYFCKKHDLVLCQKCKTKHETCDVIHIETASKDVKSGNALKHIERQIESIKRFFTKFADETNAKVESLEDQKIGIQAKIKEVKDHLVKHLDDLERDLLYNLDFEYKSAYFVLTQEEKRSRDKNKMFEMYQSQLSAIKDEQSDVDLFLATKYIEEKACTTDEEIKTMTKSSFSFKFTPLDKASAIKSIPALGMISPGKSSAGGLMRSTLGKGAQTMAPYGQKEKVNTVKVELLSTFRASEVFGSPGIASACFLDDDKLLLCPFQTKSILVCGYTGDLYETIALDHEPCFIAPCSKNQFVVSLGECGSIQLLEHRLNTSSFDLGGKIDIGGYCSGVATKEKKIMVGTTNAITVVDLEEKMLRPISTTFTPWDLKVSKNGDIFFSELVGNTIRFVPNMKIAEKVFYDFKMTDARHMTIDENGNLFVAGNTLSTIDQIKRTDSGAERYCVLTEKNDIHQPTGISYDHQTRRLMVINDTGKNVRIYSVE